MFDHAWRRWPAVPILLAALALAGAAQAAEPTYSFNIPRKPLGSALVDLALQAGASISTEAAAGCRAPAQALVGRLTLEAALTRLLSDTGCGFRRLDPHAVAIVRLPPREPTQSRAAEPASPVSLPELIVVATRRPTPADRLAYPVSSVEDRTLEAQGVQDASDLAMITPAMTVTNLGSGRDKILLRGLSDGPLTGRTQSMVGLYLDDVRVTYNAPDPDLRLVDLARVEVLRGPQGALYGAGSLGGVVHLMSQPPDPDDFSAWAAATGATTRGGEASGTAEAMVNLPILAGRGAVRGVAYSEVQGGYIDDVALGLENINRTRRNGGRLTLVLRLNAQWTATAGIVGQAINADDTQYVTGGGAPFTRRNLVREPHDNDFAEVHLGLHGDLGGAEAKWTTGVVRHRLTSRYDASAAPPIAVPAGPAAFDDDNDIASLVTEGVVSSRSEGRVQWLAGLFYATTRQDTELRLTVLDGAPAAAFQEARRDRLREGALFGEAVLPLTPALSLTLGGRAFLSEVRVSSAIAAPSAGETAAFRGRSRSSGIAPKVVLAYSRSPTALFYLQAAEGYRAGGINTTGAPGQAFGATGAPQPLRNYQGDELWSFEAGGRFSFDEGRLILRAAAFEAFWKNIQSDQLLASALPFTANIGDGRNLGLEAEGAWRAGALSLRGELLVNGPELDRANPAFPARAELGLAGVPRMSAGISAHYAWPLPNSRRIELDARYAYVGASRLTFDAATSPRMGDYATGRVAATLAAQRWRLTLAVDNPLDARGDTFAYGNPFDLRTTVQTTPLRPRTVAITLRVAY